MSDADVDKYEVMAGDILFTRSSLVREGIGQANIVSSLNERTTFPEFHIGTPIQQMMS